VRPPANASAIAAATVLTAASTVLAIESPGYVVLLLGAIWVMLPSRPDATPKWLTILILAMTFGSLLPEAASLVIQALSLLAAYLLWLSTPASERRATSTVLWASAVIAFWAVLIFHANVPTLETGLLGLRKTVFCVVGLVLGAAVARRHLPAFERTLVKILALGVGTSIALFLFAPALESSLVTRDADVYTGMLSGVARLQGIFAGPFHAATAGLILIVWGIARFRVQRNLALVCIGVGAIAVYLSLVRTAYVALAVAVAFMILASPTAGKAIRRIVGVALAAIAGGVVITATNSEAFAIVETIFEFGTDARFAGRFPGYAEGLTLITQSPIFGWGAGSAGDTLGPAFIHGEHVTSHNVLLKIGVEGGLLGLALWFGLITSAVRRLPRLSPYTPAAVGMLGILLGMGLTGSSLEALPVTFVAFVLVGLGLDAGAVTPTVGRPFAEPRRAPVRR